MKNAPLFSIYGPVISNGTLLGGAPNLFLRDGLPPPPAAPSVAPQDLAGAFRAVDLNFKSTRVQQFNVQVEREFAGNVVTAGYVGSRGSHVAMNPDINQAPAAAGAIQPRRRFSGTLPQLAQLNVFMSDYETWYDALQLIFQRRLNGGLSFNTHYQLGHAQQTQPLNWDGLTVERTDAPRDMRHSLGGTDQLRAAVGRVTHRFRARSAHRLADQRDRELPDRRTLWRYESRSASEYRRRASRRTGSRSTEPRR